MNTAFIFSQSYRIRCAKISIQRNIIVRQFWFEWFPNFIINFVIDSFVDLSYVSHVDSSFHLTWKSAWNSSGYSFYFLHLLKKCFQLRGENVMIKCPFDIVMSLNSISVCKSIFFGVEVLQDMILIFLKNFCEFNFWIISKLSKLWSFFFSCSETLKYEEVS